MVRLPRVRDAKPVWGLCKVSLTPVPRRAARQDGAGNDAMVRQSGDSSVLRPGRVTSQRMARFLHRSRHIAGSPALAARPAALAGLPGVSRADDPGQHPAVAVGHAQQRVRRPDAGHQGAGRGGGHVPHRLLLHLAGDRRGRRRLGADRPGLGRARAAQGQGDRRHRAVAGPAAGPGGGAVRRHLHRGAVARARHARRTCCRWPSAMPG